MKYISPFREFIYETIRAEDASKDLNAVQTVIDNKRDLGFITLIGSTLPTEQFWEMIDNNNLKTLKVKGNTYQAYIYYRPGAEKKPENYVTLLKNMEVIWHGTRLKKILEE
jgi:hypothetical protein